MTAPMVPRERMPNAKGRLYPVVRHDSTELLVLIELMTSVPAGVLGSPVGSIAAYRDEITRALDWLFTGV